MKRVLLVLFTTLGCASVGKVRTVEPVKTKLGHYPSVIMRVTPMVPAAEEAAQMENIIAARLRTTCGYGEVLTASTTPNAESALLVDARIAVLDRVSQTDRQMMGGLAGQARIVLAVDLIDLKTRERVGAAEIEGTSSGGSSFAGTTEEAVERAVEKVVDYMREGGCTERAPVAEPKPGETPPNPPSSQPVQPGVQAEILNQEGKDLYKNKAYAEAAAKFREAIGFDPQARFYFNLCAALDSAKDYDGALQACQDVLTRSPNEELKAKTDERIKSIQAKR